MFYQLRSMLLALSLCIGLGLSGVAMAKGVRIKSPQNLYPEGGPITLVIRNTSRVSIALPGCGAIIFERFTGEGYEPMPPESCMATGPGPVIKAGESLELTLTPRSGEDTYLRPVLTYGVGCRPGLPLDQAECKSVTSTRGRHFGHRGARGGK